VLYPLDIGDTNYMSLTLNDPTQTGAGYILSYDLSTTAKSFISNAVQTTRFSSILSNYITLEPNISSSIYPASVNTTSCSIYAMSVGTNGYLSINLSQPLTDGAGHTVVYDASPGLQNLLGRVATNDQLSELGLTVAYRNSANTCLGTDTFNNTINIKCASGWGNVHCTPSVTGAEAAIGFLKNIDNSVTSSAGDVWMIGSNLFSANPLYFSIATNTIGDCLTIDTNGNIQIAKNQPISGDLTISGNVTNPGISTISSHASTALTNSNNALSSVQYLSNIFVFCFKLKKNTCFNSILQNGSVTQYYKIGT
jgi:hypothetical protein